MTERGDGWTALLNSAAEYRRKEDFEYWSDESVAEFAALAVREATEGLQAELDAAQLGLKVARQMMTTTAMERDEAEPPKEQP